MWIMNMGAGGLAVHSELTLIGSKPRQYWVDVCNVLLHCSPITVGQETRVTKNILFVAYENEN